ncbi:MAG: carbonic anhydrase family protein [Cyanobacteria bacterium P01_E01_bin.6]
MSFFASKFLELLGLTIVETSRSLLKKFILKASTVLLLSSILCFVTIQSSAIAREVQPNIAEIQWGYEGNQGPDFWGELNQDYAACSIGTYQSPIDVQPEVGMDIGDLDFNYRAASPMIVNTGRTIRVNYSPGSRLMLDGQSYDLVQFHFHHPSEHTVDGKHYPMEMHVVHQNSDTGALAVVGIFLEIGDENPVVQLIWNDAPIDAGSAPTILDMEMNAVELLPNNTHTGYRYVGSLTTPPCSEHVQWIVLKEPVEVSMEQVEHFAATVGENARPIQSQGRARQ